MIVAGRVETLLYMIFSSGIAIFVDWQAYSDANYVSGSKYLKNIVDFVMGYVLLGGMIRNGRLGNGERPGFGSYFGIAILSGLGILLGFVFLIIPGVFLMVRWAPAYGYAMAEDSGVMVALERSFRDTEPHATPILVCQMAYVGLFFVGLAIYALSEFFDPELLWFSTVGGNIILSASLVVSAAIGLAVYSLLNQP